jgi:hypothetical protein
VTTYIQTAFGGVKKVKIKKALGDAVNEPQRQQTFDFEMCGGDSCWT